MYMALRINSIYEEKLLIRTSADVDA